MDVDWDGDAGVFLTRDALAWGHNDKSIARMVRAGLWHRIRRGAFVDRAVWDSSDAVARHRLTARAVLRTNHESAALSHATAIVEHGAPVWGVSLSEVHLSRTDGKAGRREAGVVHHRGVSPGTQPMRMNGLSVMPPARCALELTTMASVESCLVSINWMLHHRTTTPEELQRLLVSFRCWPGSLRTQLVLDLADGRCAWPGEARLSYLLWRERLPSPTPQYEIHDEAGHLVAVLDFAYPALGVFIEFDGRIKYERLRREGETLEQVVLREKRREELVCSLTGWVCLRVTWEDLSSPALTARRIRGVLASRVRPAG